MTAIKGAATIDDAKQRRAMVLRLKRIEGQLRGIQAMIEAGEDCELIVQQISASRHALDKAFFNVLACAIQSEGGAKANAEKRLRQAAELLARFG
ncbi:MAG TPA: metal-sensing transcriptional repressor [Usitatibacter sp.]|nr:metal-sensing transcriptional repressor [Usitatibacter sp.]